MPWPLSALEIIFYQQALFDYYEIPKQWLRLFNGYVVFLYFPIVFKTGGLADTIAELDEKENTGNGFVFEKYTSKELIKVIKRAIKFSKNKEVLAETQVRIMEEDFSWDDSMDKYSEVYDDVVGEE